MPCGGNLRLPETDDHLITVKSSGRGCCEGSCLTNTERIVIDDQCYFRVLYHIDSNDVRIEIITTFTATDVAGTYLIGTRSKIGISRECFSLSYEGAEGSSSSGTNVPAYVHTIQATAHFAGEVHYSSFADIVTIGKNCYCGVRHHRNDYLVSRRTTIGIGSGDGVGSRNCWGYVNTCTCARALIPGVRDDPRTTGSRSGQCNGTTDTDGIIVGSGDIWSLFLIDGDVAKVGRAFKVTPASKQVVGASWK